MARRNVRKVKIVNIQEKINYYADNMSFKFATINYIKMEQTMKDLKRYVTREIHGDKNLQVTSYDMRRWAMALNKLFKKTQSDCEFDKFKKRLEKNVKITNDIFINDCKETQKKMTLLMNLQALMLELNYYTTVIWVIEEKYKTLKEQDDDLFNDVILSALVEAW